MKAVAVLLLAIVQLAWCQEHVRSDLYGCSKSCSLHGNCVNDVCHCVAGYAGADCSVYAPMVCPMNCSGQGTCDVNTRTCFCINGFHGPDCATPNIPLFAAMSGQVLTCVNSCSSRGVCSHGVCFCDQGYGGDDCSLSLAALERAPRHTSIVMKAEYGAPLNPPIPASGDSLAVIDSYDNSRIKHYAKHVNAEARAQYQGDSQRAVPVQGAPSDQMYQCPSNCSNHGTCNVGPQGNGVCVCDAGWEGIDCGYERSCPNNCMGHGQCVNGACQCDAGYTGFDCSQLPSCRHRCFGHGYCVYGHCVCDPGYSGPDCREAMFCAGDCSGHGSCTQGKCACNNGFYGPDCANRAFNMHEKGNYCPNGCSGNGVCDDGKSQCKCFKGFEGHDCGRFAHSEVPLENVVDASSPYEQPSADDESMINTGDEGDPNADQWKNSQASMANIAQQLGLDGPFPTPQQIAKWERAHKLSQEANATASLAEVPEVVEEVAPAVAAPIPTRAAPAPKPVAKADLEEF